MSCLLAHATFVRDRLLALFGSISSPLVLLYIMHVRLPHGRLCVDCYPQGNEELRYMHAFLCFLGVICRYFQLHDTISVS